MAAKTKHLEALPPGYKFNPTDAELVDDYLLKKASCMAFYEQDFQEIDAIEFYSNPPQSLGIAYHFLSFSFLLNTDLCVYIYIYIYIIASLVRVPILPTENIPFFILSTNFSLHTPVEHLF
jgi:hypothetical protein